MTNQPMKIDPSMLIFKQAIVEGFWGSKISREMHVKNKQRLINELITRVYEAKPMLPVEVVYNLADTKTAVSDEVQKGKQGKVLLRV